MKIENESSGLVRSLSLSQAVMIGVASMIGGAIFVLVDLVYLQQDLH